MKTNCSDGLFFDDYIALWRFRVYSPNKNSIFLIDDILLKPYNNQKDFISNRNQENVKDEETIWSLRGRWLELALSRTETKRLWLARKHLETLSKHGISKKHEVLLCNRRKLRGKYMLGVVIGDIIGSWFEADNHKSKSLTKIHHRGFLVLIDDSIMTLAATKPYY